MVEGQVHLYIYPPPYVSTRLPAGRGYTQDEHTTYLPQVQLPAAQVQLPPQSQLVFPQPDIS
jgi:hypothetical protein